MADERSITVQLTADGDLAEVPPEIQAIFDRVAAGERKKATVTAMEEVTKDAKRQIEQTVKERLAEHDAMAPVQAKRLESLEGENRALAEKLSETTTASDQQRRTLEDSHARDLMARNERLEARERKIRELTGQSLLGVALKHGASEQALEVLTVYFGSRIGYDEDMNPYVRGEDGEPMTSQGKAVTVDQFVADFLAKNPNFRSPVGRKAAPAPGGIPASQVSMHRPVSISQDAARDRIRGGDRSAQAITELYESVAQDGR